MVNKKIANKPYDLSLTSIGRGILLLLIPITAYILSALPAVIFLFYTFNILQLSGVLFSTVATIILFISFVLFLISEIFIPALFIRIFNIKTPYGTHELSITDKAFFNHMLFFLLYRPALLCTSIIPLVPLRLRLLKIVGLQIGNESMIAGTELIDEPYGVEIGTNTLIGGLSTIFAHISREKLYMKKVKIGNHCFIGNKSVIMPGVTIEDHVIIEPGTVVGEDQVLKEGKRYHGNPAVEIKKT